MDSVTYPWYHSKGGLNHANVNDAEMDRLLVTQRREKNPEAQKALVAQPAVRGGNLLVIEPPGPLAIPDAIGETIPAAPDLLAYAELRYRGTGQATEAADLLLPRVLGDATD